MWTMGTVGTMVSLPPQSGDIFIEKDYPHEKVRPRRGRILVWCFCVSINISSLRDFGLVVVCCFLQSFHAFQDLGLVVIVVFYK